jgi:integrase
VEQTGSRVKTWKGFYYEYVTDDNGVEKRTHRSRTLGKCAEISKRQAEKDLAAFLLHGLNLASSGASSVRTIASFVKHEYLPLRTNWGPATSDNFKNYWGPHILPKYGAMALTDITRLMVQTHLNDLATAGYSRHLVSKLKTHIVSILSAAVEADYLAKNPVAKCVIPNHCKEQVKNTIGIDDYLWFTDEFKQPRDRALFLIGGFCALRPSELVAVRWMDYNGVGLMIRSRVYKGKVANVTKTKESKGLVYIPADVREYLDAWRAQTPNAAPEDYIFSGWCNQTQSKMYHKPLKPQNWLCDTLRPLCKKRGLSFNVTFQILRRTAGTIAQQYGSLKDVQAMYRHSRISTTAEIYVQTNAASVMSMMDGFAGAALHPTTQNPTPSSKLTLVKKTG